MNSEPEQQGAARRRRRRDSTNAATAARCRACGCARRRGDGQRALAHLRSVGMSRRLLTTSSAQARRPTAHPITSDSAVTARSHEGRARRGDQAEEHEHEQLAEAEVAVGLRAAGVEPAAAIAAAPTSEQPPRRGRREGQAGDRGDAERQQRRPLHRCRPGEPGGHEAHRADPDVVGAAHAVAVVVGVVHADLRARRHDQRSDDAPPHDRRPARRRPRRRRRRRARPRRAGCGAGRR